MSNDAFISSCKEFADKINEKYPLTAAYLFGSRAKNIDNAMSDIDIAIFFKDNYSSTDDVFIRGGIIESGYEFFKIPVDIISLNKAPLSLSYEIIKEGILVLDNSPARRIELETRILREYLDFKYYSDTYNSAILKSIKNNEYFGG